MADEIIQEITALNVDLTCDGNCEGCEKFLCVQCKKTFNKQGGHKWSGNEYICEECFLRM